MFPLFLPNVVVKVVHLIVEAFLLSGSIVVRIVESANSSSSRRTFETIMNCSAQLYSTRSTTRGNGVYWERVKIGCQNRAISPLVYVSKASKAS